MLSPPPQKNKTLESHSSTGKKGLRLAGDILIDLRLVGEYFFITRCAEKNKRSLKDAQHSKEAKRSVLTHMHTHTHTRTRYALGRVSRKTERRDGGHYA